MQSGRRSGAAAASGALLLVLVLLLLAWTPLLLRQLPLFGLQGHGSAWPKRLRCGKHACRCGAAAAAAAAALRRGGSRQVGGAATAADGAPVSMAKRSGEIYSFGRTAAICEGNVARAGTLLSAFSKPLQVGQRLKPPDAPLETRICSIVMEWQAAASEVHIGGHSLHAEPAAQARTAMRMRRPIASTAPASPLNTCSPLTGVDWNGVAWKTSVCNGTWRDKLVGRSRQGYSRSG